MLKKLKQTSLIQRATLLLCLTSIGCAVLAERQWNEAYGEPGVVERISQSPSESALEFHRDIKPITDQRCVVCHACYDAPCQLKLSSFEGLDRGASQVLVYNGTRILADEPSRLFVDANSTQAWRQKGYYPVLNERTQNPETNLLGSTLYRMLKLKQAHPLPEGPILPDSFELGSDRSQQCSPIESFEQYEKSYPQWGMPYGLPGISNENFKRIEQWIAEGATAAPQPPIPESYRKQMKIWEDFFNQDSLKARLASRYMYEHLYLANLYFDELKADQTSPEYFFKLVRSSTPPGQDIKEIASRRPFDDPEVERVYYRLRPVISTIVDKTHMPYALSPERRELWKALFFNDDYEVTSLPGYDPVTAANPFLTFKSIPAKSRYRFMLDEAQYTIMGYIKGPVCRGQVALNVIEDQFWVFFVDPDVEQMLYESHIREDNLDHLVLPAADESNALPTEIWTKYADLQNKHLQEKLQYIREKYPEGSEVTINAIWDGDGHNPNAALTILRHFDAATVLKGLHGPKPKTAWVITYSLLERIHYLLVAGFDVYGNLGHQLNTRLYMDFLRMEGESNFLVLLPLKSAEKEFKHWYRGAESEVKDYIKILRESGLRTNLLNYQSNQHKAELLDKLIDFLGPDIAQKPSPEHALHSLTTLQGSYLRWMPENTMLRLRDKTGQSQAYTVLVNRAHSNVSSLLWENDRLIPAEDNLTVLPGLIGSYPNSFLDITSEDVPALAHAIKSLNSEEDYRALKARFGVRRTDERFWEFADWLHQWKREHTPMQSGLLDFNRLENR